MPELKIKTMPYIKIEVIRDGITREQKRTLIKGITDLITDVLNKDPQLTYVVIEEINQDNWGFGGKTVTEHKEMGGAII